jgi:Arc/MetJ family transcription regulator
VRGNLDDLVHALDFESNVDDYSYNHPHDREEAMRTIQMTLDDELVETVDKVVKKLKTTRSAFARKALKDAVKQVDIKMLENKHKRGYGLHPVDKTEFSVWESEQAWDDL